MAGLLECELSANDSSSTFAFNVNALERACFLCPEAGSPVIVGQSQENSRGVIGEFPR